MGKTDFNQLPVMYMRAKQGALQKWADADGLIELAASGKATVSQLEIVEVQKCATMLDEFAHQLYVDPTMWSPIEIDQGRFTIASGEVLEI
jgi:hypothetical protein